MSSTRSHGRLPGASCARFVVLLSVATLMPALAARPQDDPPESRGAIVKSKSAVIKEVPPADPTPSYRKPDPTEVLAPPGYVVEVYAGHLDFPVDVAFSDAGDVYIAEAGFHGFGTSSTRAPSPQIIQVRPDGTELVVFENTVSMEEIRKESSSSRMPEGIIPPITGLTWRDGKLYIAHRSRISALDLSDPNAETRFKTIVNGLPEWGEFLGGKPIFDRDGKLVFFVSSQGNAGVVDEHWAKLILEFNKLGAHEVPGEDVTLTGRNFHVPLEMSRHAGEYIKAPDEAHTVEIKERTAHVPYAHEHRLQPPEGDARTGAFVPLWTPTRPGQVVKGEKICNGAFFRCNPDGSDLERIAWGFRSCFGYRFAPDGRLFCTQNGANPLGPRKLWFDTETIYEVVPGEWYGWPDFFGGLPITDGRFAIKEGPQEFLLTAETHRRLLKGRALPRQPLVRLAPHSAAQGMVFGRREFGLSPNSLLVAEMGTIVPAFKGGYLFWPEEWREERVRILEHRPQAAPPDADFDWPGFKVQLVDLATGRVQDFLTNRVKGPASAARGGGLERPVQLEWGPDGALYVVDFGVVSALQRETRVSHNAHVGTGVIWRVRREGAPPLRGGG